MTNFKGTPGKWLVKENNKTSIFPIVEIAPMRFITVEGTNHIEPEYNALLISKAPEMLEMLEACHKRLYLIGIQNGSIDSEPLIRLTENLIKEATEL